MSNFLRSISVLEVMICGAIAGILLLVAVMVYDDYIAEKFSLRKDEWTCTEHKDEIYPMMVGKIMTMQHRDICINWKKNG